MSPLRAFLCIALSLLLTVPPGTVLAAPFPRSGMSEEEVRDLIRSEIERVSTELEKQLAAQQASFSLLLQQVTRDAEALRAEAEKTAEAVKEKLETEAGKRAQELLGQLPVEGLHQITRETPREVVDVLQKRAEETAKKLQELAEKTRGEFQETLRRRCPTEDLLRQELPDWTTAQWQLAAGAVRPHAQRLGRVREDGREQVHELAAGGRWSAELLAWLPDELVPVCAKDPELRKRARETAEVDAVTQMGQTMMTSAMTAALSTGNPYVIAIVAVLSILAAIFGGQGGGGGGGGKNRGDGPNKSGGSGISDDGPNGEDNESGGSNQASGTGPDPNVEVDSTGLWEVEGSWPRYTLVSRTDEIDRCSIDFTQVEREDEPWSPDQASTVIVGGSCDRQGGRHSITIKVTEGPNQVHYYKGTFSEGIWSFVPDKFWKS